MHHLFIMYKYFGNILSNISCHMSKPTKKWNEYFIVTGFDIIRELLYNIVGWFFPISLSLKGRCT